MVTMRTSASMMYVLPAGECQDDSHPDVTVSTTTATRRPDGSQDPMFNKPCDGDDNDLAPRESLFARVAFLGAPTRKRRNLNCAMA